MPACEDILDVRVDAGLMTSSSTTTRSPSMEVRFEVPSFAKLCYDAAQEAWGASYTHPFLTSLLDGSLDPARFRRYQMQDARYLESYADACSVISVRVPDPEKKLWFIEAARLALVVERELHEGYGKTLGYTPADIATLKLTPDNHAYQNHLLVAAYKGTLLEAVAALAPCPWLYAEIGQKIAERVDAISPEHPFRDWLVTYADPSFVTYTNELLGHLQELSVTYSSKEHHQAAVSAFVKSTRYEWMFWQQAWTDQEWPVGEKSGAGDRVEPVVTGRKGKEDVR